MKAKLRTRCSTTFTIYISYPVRSLVSLHNHIVRPHAVPGACWSALDHLIAEVAEERAQPSALSFSLSNLSKEDGIGSRGHDAGVETKVAVI